MNETNVSIKCVFIFTPFEDWSEGFTIKHYVVKIWRVNFFARLLFMDNMRQYVGKRGCQVCDIQLKGMWNRFIVCQLVFCPGWGYFNSYIWRMYPSTPSENWPKFSLLNQNLHPLPALSPLPLGVYIDKCNIKQLHQPNRHLTIVLTVLRLFSNSLPDETECPSFSTKTLHKASPAWSRSGSILDYHRLAADGTGWLLAPVLRFL